MSDLDCGTEISHPSQASHLPVAFWVLLALAVTVRSVGIARPLLGNFASRNAINAMVARNWAEGRASPWLPTVDCLIDGRRGLLMLDLPLSAYASGGLWKLLGGSLDVWGRATAVAFTAASVWLLFLFVRRRHGQTAGLGAAGVLALSPVAIIHGQAFMLEPSLLLLTLATFYCADRWLEEERPGWLVASATCLALVILAKIYMLVLLLPLAIMGLAGRRSGTLDDRHALSRRGQVFALVAVMAALVPAAAWYVHATYTARPGGALAQHVYYSVRQSASVHRPPHPLLWTPDFYRQILDDLVGVVLTPLGFALLVLGFFDRAWRDYLPWLLAMLVLVLLLPLKFYELNYYYMAVLPPLCIVAGLGWQAVCRCVHPGRMAVVGLMLFALLLSLRYAGRAAFVTPAEDQAVLAAARAVRQNSMRDEPVVTMHGTCVDLLYYCDRPGWAIAPDTPDLERVLRDCHRRGARLVVVAGSPDEDTRLPVPTSLVGQPPAVQGPGYRVLRIPFPDKDGRSGRR